MIYRALYSVSVIAFLKMSFSKYAYYLVASRINIQIIT